MLRARLRHGTICWLSAMKVLPAFTRALQARQIRQATRSSGDAGQLGTYNRGRMALPSATEEPHCTLAGAIAEFGELREHGLPAASLVVARPWRSRRGAPTCAPPI
jgi:hypothetical protein